MIPTIVSVNGRMSIMSHPLIAEVDDRRGEYAARIRPASRHRYHARDADQKTATRRDGAATCLLRRWPVERARVLPAA